MGTDLNLVAAMLSAARRPEALPSPLVRMEYAPEAGGWAVELADGTRLLWGGMRWTEDKLRRLREVLADASPRFDEALRLDLRHFEDGRILVRPG